MRYARIVLFVLALCLLTSFVMAADYEIRTTAINDSILPNETAAFKFSISNFERQDIRFQIFTFDTHWVLLVNPPIVTVKAQSLQEFIVQVKPKTSVGYGTSGVTVTVKELGAGVLSQESLIIHIIDPNQQPGGYVPSIQFTPSYPASIDPRNPLLLTLNYRNRNALNITDLSVAITSPLFNRSYDTALGPLAEKSEEQAFDLDPYQRSGDYPLRIILSSKNKTVNDFAGTLSIAPITDVQEARGGSSFLFRSATTLTLTNRGNTPTAYEARLPTSLLRMPFSNANPLATTAVIAGDRYYVWNLTLQPQQTVILTRVENYRLLVVLILVAIAAAIAYFLLRSPLIAVKETIALKDEEEGVSSALKVRIFLKNRTGQQLTAVSVIDRIPSIATYKAQEHLGTVSPTKVVTTEKKGTMLKWELDLLEPYEERILSYSLASRLKIMGRMRLPAAKALFATKAGREHVIYTKSTTYDEKH